MRRGEAGRGIGIVGGGVGGLALAALLATRGHRVHVYERGDLGGKLGRLTLAGPDGPVSADTGPSLFTFPGVWRSLLVRLGERDPLDLAPLPGLGPHHTRHGVVPLPVPQDHPLFAHWQRYETELSGLAPHVETLLTTPPDVRDSTFVTASAALGRVVGGRLTAGRWLEARAFPPALHDAFAAHALNAGVGPRRGSALYALLPGLVGRDVHHPRGGMFTLVEALVRFGLARGVRYLPHTPILTVRPDTAELTWEGGSARHDLLVSAVDPDRLARLVGRAARADGPRTVSGVALYVPLAVPDRPHTTVPTTVIVPDDLDAFETATRLRALPRTTLGLVHVWARHVAVLLAAPAHAGRLTPDHPWIRGRLDDLSRRVDLPDLKDAAVLTPADLALGGAPGGAIYGRQVPVWRSGPLHPNPYRLGPRLWQVGAGVHPGGGLPAVLGGAMIVDELLRRAART